MLNEGNTRYKFLYKKGLIDLKKITLVLAFIFIFSLAVPLQGFAAGMDKGLEDAIKIAKSKFAIPQSYEFESSIGMEGTKKIYSLQWRSKDTADNAYISVRIDENGVIVGYSRYSQDDYKNAGKLPKVDRREAKAKAEAFIEKIEPGLLKKLQYEEPVQTGGLDASYNFAYYRVENNVPFYTDRVTVNVNRDTGELQDYNRQWTDKITFPAVKDVLPVGDAEAAYVKNIGLRLVYKYSYTDDVLKIFPAYVPVYDNAGYGIDASTGERIKLMPLYYGVLYDRAGAAFNESAKTAASGEVQLNPDEIKAVQEAAKLISLDEAEKIARNAEFLKIPKDSKMQSYYLGRNWPDANEYVYNLYFVKKADDTSLYDLNYNVSLNAGTGTITGFNIYSGKPDGTKLINDVDTAKKAADDFLAKYYPEYYKQLEYDKLASENNISNLKDGKSASYNFVYSRLVNGVLFPDNGVNVSYDNISGTINGFNLNWFGKDFPSVDKVIGTEAASQELFKSVGLGLEYNYEYKDNGKSTGEIPEGSKVVPVYSLKRNKPLMIDAYKERLLNSDGTPYEEPVKVNYTDIKGNAAENQIMVLAENGIYLEGTEFKPDSAITQLDFLTLLSKSLNYYIPFSPKKTDKEVDDLYARLQREGIVKADERAPEGAVTKEDAVKFIIRALKYDKVADIEGIYNCTLKDKDDVSPALVGYVTIAAGLGIIDGEGEFKPKADITRGESAIMIYNYLQS